MTSRTLVVATLVSVLAACSSSHPGLPDPGDGGTPALPDDGGPALPDDGGPPALVDAGGPRVDCSPRELARAERVVLDRAVVGADRRTAITWTRAWTTETTYETRSFLGVIGDLGTSEVVAREIPGGLIAPFADGYAVPVGYQPASVHVLDLEGAETRAPIALPETWRVDGERFAASGRLLRGEALNNTESRVERPAFELALDGREPSAQVFGDAPDHVVTRLFDRELVLAGERPRVVYERALPDGAAGPEIGWPQDIRPIVAQLDAERDRWIVLGEERFFSEAGDFAGTRPAIVSVPRDGRAVQVTSVEVEHGMRTVTGSLALGPDAALLVVDDFHGQAFAVRVALDTLVASDRMEVDGMWRGLALWHAPSESFALVTQTRPYDDTTAIAFRCGL